MSAKSPTPNKGAIAFGSLSGAMLGLIAIGSVPKMPWFVGIPAFSGGLCAVAGAIGRHGKHGLSLNDYADGLAEFSEDCWETLEGPLNWLGDKAEPVIQETIVPRMPSIAQLLLDAAQAECDDSWITSEVICNPKFVLGGRGTGKTTWMRYQARRFKAENPDGILRIVDLHHNEDDGPWLPGIPEEEYLATDIEEAIAVIREAMEEGRKRVASGSRKHPQYHLIIDEYQGVCARLSDSENEELSNLVQFVLDELRKYHVNVTLSSKSIKQKMTGIDSSLIAQMDWLALGNSLADPSAKLPLDLEPKELLKKRSILSKLPGCRFACIYRPADEDPEVRVIPADLPERTAAYTFRAEDDIPESERWKAENRAIVLQLLAEGKSKTRIAQDLPGFGRRDATNYRWGLLVQWEEEFKASHPAEPIEVPARTEEEEALASASAFAR